MGEANAESYRLAKSVFFVGFMGAGKTTVARCLSSKYGFAAVDADEFLESSTGRVIADIFAEEGEAFFRDLETSCLEKIASGEPALVSCGGGVIKRAENVRLMRERGFVIYLDTTAEASAERITDVSSRPLFKDIETARAVLAVREPLYQAAAHSIVNVVGRPVPVVVEEVLQLLIHEGIVLRVYTRE